MWDSFEKIGSNIWDSIDDIFISVGLLLLTTILSKHLYFFMNDYLILGHFTAQLTQVGLFFAVVVLVVQHLFGAATSSAILGGFSIGFGYALQPYIIALFNGFVLRQGINNHQWLEIPNVLPQKRMKIKYIGMFHTCLDETDAGNFFVSNSLLTGHPFGIYNTKG